MSRFFTLILNRLKARYSSNAALAQHPIAPDNPPVAATSTVVPVDDKQSDASDDVADMAYRLREIARFPKQYCFRCDQRNDIDNLFFCMRCGEIRCWQCINDYEQKLDSTDGKMHHVCICGDFLKSWDDWNAQVKKSASTHARR